MTKILSKQNISLSIFIFINFIFVVKYSSRVTDYYWILALLTSAFYGLLWLYQSTITKYLSKIPYINYFLLGGFIIASIFIFKIVSVDTLNVDRWSVITSFWDAYFSNKYVYYAESNVGNYPGPMPFYFIMALPFYFVNELGYYSLLGLFLFYFLLTKLKTSNITVYLILLTLSPFYLWEIVSRSNIFTNGMLVLLGVLYVLKLVNQTSSIKNNVLIGLTVGLLLSTRNVFVIPFIFTFIYLLKINRLNFKRLTIIGLYAITFFSFTFLPFAWNFYDDFLKMNPFIIQSSFLMPLSWSIASVFIALVIAWFSKTENDIYFYSGIVLFATIVAHFIYNITQSNFNETFFNSRADISYFILCIPFVMYHFLNKKNKAL